MITPAYAVVMARYNAWQNANIYDAASLISDEQRRQDRGAFFGSIDATLNHILWADEMWLMRLAAGPAPQAKSISEGLTQHADWLQLKAARDAMDARISRWAEALTDDDVAGDLTWYSASAGRELTSPRAALIIHLFNHQTHHRGQAHAILTGFGVKPGPTDLPWGPVF